MTILTIPASQLQPGDLWDLGTETICTAHVTRLRDGTHVRVSGSVGATLTNDPDLTTSHTIPATATLTITREPVAA